MLFGPEKVLACPDCGSLVRAATLLSGNTFGAIHWTDGKLVAPMLPQLPVIHQCGACRSFFWLADAPEVGQIELNAPEQAPASWREAPAVEHLAAEGYLEALAAGLAVDPDQERELRILAWWGANDAYRAPTRDWHHPGKLELPPAFESNLRRLLEMLDPEQEEDRLLKAEVARQLGDFVQCQALLEDPVAGRYREAAARIRDLARNGDRLVRPI